jgi:tryptophan halogenase
MGTSAFEPPAPFTRINAEPGGWSWQVPLRDQLVQGRVFDGSRIDADAALKKAAQIQARAIALRFTNGRRREAWRGNCVALGAAAGFLEPLASTGLQLINEGVTRLVSLFPDRGSAAVMALEYNRVLGAMYDGARDFVLLHYVLAGRPEAPWSGQVAATWPPSLARRVEMFRYRGRVVLNDDEIFEEPDWACTFVGQGEKPLHHSILVDQVGDAEVVAQVAKIARVMQAAVQTLPPHHAYLERYLA